MLLYADGKLFVHIYFYSDVVVRKNGVQLCGHW